MFEKGLWILFLIFLIGNFICPTVGYYPGLRRPPISSLEDPTNILTQLFEEHARRRFQKQFAQNQFYNHQNHHHNSEHGPHIDDIDPESYSGPGFSYNFPENQKTIFSDNLNPYENIVPFAVNPTDPRFFEGRPTNNMNLQKTLNTFENDLVKNNNYNQVEQTLLDPDNKDDNDEIIKDVPYYKPKIPVSVTPKLTLQQAVLPKPFRGRDDIKKLVQKLEAEGKANTILNDKQQQLTSQINSKQMNEELVVRQHLGMDGDMGMYMVALLAGITAAVIVGVMALGVAWITLQKRSKAAADVEYPAYGVTGPNKDISPSGDRRLAQSAQMYHYQHQKQQIIAMENRQNGEHHSGGLSDVESDDDNEEGDYTVYECPGLAPTGEMEVKNPLFLDDTPITPVATVTTTPPPTTTTTNTTNGSKTSQPSQKQQTIQNDQQQNKSPSSIIKPQKQAQPPPTPQRKSPRSNGPKSSDNSGNKKK